jgi:hypothetical protein
VVLIASGRAQPHLPHAFARCVPRGRGEEHIFSEEARRADHGVIEAWCRGDHASVIDNFGEFMKVRPEGTLRPLSNDDRRPGRTRVRRARSALIRRTRTPSAPVRFTCGSIARERVGGGVTLRGVPFPRTPTGQASLLPPLPWHYSGDLLTVEYRTDPSAPWPPSCPRA